MEFREVRGPHVALHDLAALVHDEGRGGELHVAPGLGHRAGVVDGHLEGELAGLREVHHVARRVVAHGHGQRIEAAVAVLAVGGHDLRHLGHAGGATGRPEIHEGDLPAEVRGGLAAAVEQHEGGFRGLGASRAQEDESAHAHEGRDRSGADPMLQAHHAVLPSVRSGRAARETRRTAAIVPDGAVRRMPLVEHAAGRKVRA